MFVIKQDNTSPSIQAVLRAADKSVVDLNGASVRFIMTHESGSPAIDRPATILDVENAIVQYLWQEGDTTKPGVFFAEFEVTYRDLTVESFPNNGSIIIKVKSR